MTKQRVKEIRNSIGLSQTELGLLIGCHRTNVSNMERGFAKPSPYQRALLLSFCSAGEKTKGIGRLMRDTIELEGSTAALYRILGIAFGEADG